MSDSAAPWRTLEDVPGGEVAVGGAAGDRRLPTAGLVAAFATAAVLVVVAFWIAASSSGGSVSVEGASAAGDVATNSVAGVARTAPKGSDRAELVVDVQGAVVHPGVIRLPPGSRVGDAITVAGGFGPRVAADRVSHELNLAALLRDGDQVVVPSRDDPTAPGPAGGSAAPGNGGSAGPAAGPLDLNRASAGELDGLPGIGPVTAAKIVAAREERPFTSIDELRTRKVVGSATFDKIKDLVTVP